MKIPRHSWFNRMVISLRFYYEYPLGKDLKNFGDRFPPLAGKKVQVNGIVM
jgi:hypothetical protein